MYSVWGIFETNFKKLCDFKIERYRNLKDDLIDQSKKLKKLFIEISRLGFYTKNIIEFERTCKTITYIQKETIMIGTTQMFWSFINPLITDVSDHVETGCLFWIEGCIREHMGWSLSFL